MKITIFGTGYVGLVTGTCLAEIGHEILCIDVDTNKIQGLRKGIVPIYEPGLEELIIKNTKNGRLSFSTDAKAGVEFGKVVFSAVGTPPDKNHKADLQYVKQVAKTFGENLNEYKVFINKSTVPVGTGEICKKIIQQETKTSFDIVSNPEFLREGTAIKDFMTPDRIVCGIETAEAQQVMEEVYKPLTRSYSNIIFTDIPSSEVSKYAANAFLATKLSFINEIANFVELAGGNITDISKILGTDSRIGSRFLHAGIGYGGSCFPKDVNALIETGKEHGYNFQIIQATENINQIQKLKPIEKLKKHVPDLTGKKIAIWGLSFKPKTDDVRDAPSLEAIQRLIDLGVSEISCYDPISSSHVQNIFRTQSKVTFTNNYYDTIQDSHALLLLTEWDEFRSADIHKIFGLMEKPCIIDGRNIWNREEMEKIGFTYEAIGK